MTTEGLPPQYELAVDLARFMDATALWARQANAARQLNSPMLGGNQWYYSQTAFQELFDRSLGSINNALTQLGGLTVRVASNDGQPVPPIKFNGCEGLDLSKSCWWVRSDKERLAVPDSGLSSRVVI